MLEKVTLFADCSGEFMVKLATQLEPLVFLPGDMIVHSGDLCVEMYFVKKGRCAVLDGETTPTVVAEVRAGQYFGESALMKAQRHKHTVRSIDYCNLLVLRQQSFDIIL